MSEEKFYRCIPELNKECKKNNCYINGGYCEMTICKEYSLKGLLEEIERQNKLISQREKKWEKWTTEKTILSTKMSDYLCKYQNLKREYTKQIKLSTDRKKEVERLNNIIKEAREYHDNCINNLLDLDKIDDNERLAYKVAYEIHENYSKILGSDKNDD